MERCSLSLINTLILCKRVGPVSLILCVEYLHSLMRNICINFIKSVQLLVVSVSESQSNVTLLSDACENIKVYVKSVMVTLS